jgi:hypothetical protein
MTNFKAIDLPYPPRWVNSYIATKLGEYIDTGVSGSPSLVPVLATSPSNTDEIWSQLINSSPTSNPLLIQYDRLMRFRASPFYEIKKEQIMYYLYSTNLEYVNNAVIVISQLLDREDVAAQDLNSWCVANSGTHPLLKDRIHNVFFHNIRVYQADETRDVTELASARAVYVNKIIIEYDYHPKWNNTPTPAGQDLT